jgi:hypothetical protein
MSRGIPEDRVDRATKVLLEESVHEALLSRGYKPESVFIGTYNNLRDEMSKGWNEKFAIVHGDSVPEARPDDVDEAKFKAEYFVRYVQTP